MSAYFAEGTPAMIALEEMVDKANTRNVLYALAHICFEKGEHINANWQDKTTAGAWIAQGNLIDQLANRLGKRANPSG